MINAEINKNWFKLTYVFTLMEVLGILYAGNYNHYIINSNYVPLIIKLCASQVATSLSVTGDVVLKQYWYRR